MYMKTNFQTVNDLKNAILSNTQLQDAFKTDPVRAAETITDSSPLESDVWIYRIVVSCLGLIVLAITMGVIILIGQGKISDDKSVPTILTAIGSAAIGALAGLLAPSPVSKRN